MLGDSHRKIREGLGNLKSVRHAPLGRAIRFLQAIVLVLCTLFLASVLYALHEVDHRFTVEGRICGEQGEGIGAVVVSVKDTRADISGNGKTDRDGFYKVVLHLHNENQGDPLVVQSGAFEAAGRVDLDPNDPKTERIVTVNLGRPCRALPFWSQTWVLAGGITLFGILIVWAYRQVAGKKGKRLGPSARKKDRKR